MGEQEGHRIEPGTPSEIETSLAFLRAGGSLETWTVDVHELFTAASRACGWTPTPGWTCTRVSRSCAGSTFAPPTTSP